MKQEVKHFKRVNQNLDLIVKDLQMRMRGLCEEKEELVEGMSGQRELIKRFKEDTAQTLSMHSNDYKLLKQGIIRLFKTYATEETKSEQKKSQQDGAQKSKGVEFEFFKEYSDNRKHLECALEQVRLMLLKNSKQHKSQYSKIMKENTSLLFELNALQVEQHKLNGQFAIVVEVGDTQQHIDILVEGADFDERNIVLMQQQSEELDQNLDTLRRMVSERMRQRETQGNNESEL